jgi:hypothetical protein
MNMLNYWGNTAYSMTKGNRMIKIRSGHGYYLIDSWDDIFSLRVCTTSKQREFDWGTNSLLNHEQDKLQDDGKLEGLVWIDDKEDMENDFHTITRRWAKQEHSRYISDKFE